MGDGNVARPLTMWQSPSLEAVGEAEWADRMGTGNIRVSISTVSFLLYAQDRDAITKSFIQRNR